MKKLVNLSALVALFLLMSTHLLRAQYVMYSWTDSVTVTTSSTTLTTSNPYYSLTAYTDTIDVWIKWNDAQTYILLKSGATIKWGAYDKVTSVTIKAVEGYGRIYFAGLKTVRQTSAGTF